jgi:ankyrin repeat protein
LESNEWCGQIVNVLVARVEGEEQRREYVNMSDGRTGNTPLHYAAEKGRQSMIRCLVQLGAGT